MNLDSQTQIRRPSVNPSNTLTNVSDSHGPCSLDHVLRSNFLYALRFQVASAFALFPHHTKLSSKRASLRPDMTKYIIVSGGVISGIGKGVIGALYCAFPTVFAVLTTNPMYYYIWNTYPVCFSYTDTSIRVGKLW